MTILKKFQLQIQKQALKELSDIPVEFQLKIKNVLDNIVLNPYRGKKLHGKYEGYYSVRAWPYRIIYEIFELEVVVVVIKIGHRKDVYR